MKKKKLLKPLRFSGSNEWTKIHSNRVLKRNNMHRDQITRCIYAPRWFLSYGKNTRYIRTPVTVLVKTRMAGGWKYCEQQLLLPFFFFVRPPQKSSSRRNSRVFNNNPVGRGDPLILCLSHPPAVSYPRKITGDAQSEKSFYFATSAVRLFFFSRFRSRSKQWFFHARSGR